MKGLRRALIYGAQGLSGTGLILRRSSAVVASSRTPAGTSRCYITCPNPDGSKEVRIPMPWGHIAGKEWGPPDGTPVLAVHGWQDNAGTFDTLAPLLRQDLRILAIDLPGCGCSSHVPKGIFMNHAEMMVAVHRVVMHMKWNQFIYLGHSMGSIVGYIYCATFPELVTHYIGIEALKPIVSPIEKLQKSNRKTIEKFLEFEAKTTTPSYAYEEAVERMVKGYMGSITTESCKILLKRGLTTSPSGQGFIYSRDPRTKVGRLELGYSEENLLQYASNIRCHVLNLKAKQGFNYEPYSIYKGAVEALRKTAASVKFVEIEGTHHVHLNDPERVAPVINDFIKI